MSIRIFYVCASLEKLKLIYLFAKKRCNFNPFRVSDHFNYPLEMMDCFAWLAMTATGLQTFLSPLKPYHQANQTAKLTQKPSSFELKTVVF